ncbi:hypothetical protein E4U42_007097 [Claviceps africana]|uniref:Serine peptidase n=1 Tax=Claviceps africana TaxID=83212 RepID=A0A8K0J267_9HYPO|nr:hypothetical protein E4U42_007097 [Claviceps africana]
MHSLACFGAIASTLLLLLHPAEAGKDIRPRRPPPPEDFDLEVGLDSAESHGSIKSATFQQLIDHRNPGLGTFSQRYWYNDKWYAGPGAPIVLRAPEESDGWDGFLLNTTQSGMFGQTNRAAVIHVEHRYYGESSPFANLTVANLQHLTLDNAIQDLVYFANNVVFPFDKKRSSSPDKAPWVLTGCSYAGALTAWIYRLAPGTFWAYHCSSAVVEAIPDFWEYYAPVEAAMPRNCSKDVKSVVKHIDQVLSSDDVGAKYALKKRFALQGLSHNNDFVVALEFAFASWQGTSFIPPKTQSRFFQFCDYVENVFPETKTHHVPGPEGVGLEKALNGWARWTSEVFVPGWCGDYDYWQGDNKTVACFDYNNDQNPFYHDLSIENQADRQWKWLLCNEAFEWWRVQGPPGVDPGLVSKFADLAYTRMMCEKMFPWDGKYAVGLDAGRSAATVNKMTGGWDFGKTKRLMWTAGEYDPWRPATVAADRRPGGPLPSSPEAPVWVIPKAAHCSDAYTKAVQYNADFARIFNEILVKMKSWVDEFYVEKNVARPL